MSELDVLVVEFEIQVLRQAITKLQNDQRLHYTAERVELISKVWGQLQNILNNR